MAKVCKLSCLMRHMVYTMHLVAMKDRSKCTKRHFHEEPNDDVSPPIVAITDRNDVRSA